jgi:hypothetical protein
MTLGRSLQTQMKGRQSGHGTFWWQDKGRMHDSGQPVYAMASDDPYLMPMELSNDFRWPGEEDTTDRFMDDPDN